MPPRNKGGTLADFPEGWTECIFIGGAAKRSILTTPNFPSPLIKPPKTRHRIVATANGFEMFATRDLKMNDLIFTERPLLIAPRGPPMGSTVPPGTSMEQKLQVMLIEYENILREAYKRMQSESQAALLKLANSHTEDGSGPILGVLRTNGFGVNLAPGSAKKLMHSSVYDQLSRINHSCAPNAAISFYIASFSSQLRAVRDIKKGEEIFVAYCDFNELTAVRQKKLDPCGSKCTCQCCTNPDHDALLKEIIQSMERYAPIPAPGADHQAQLDNSLQWMAKIEAAGMQILPQYERHMDAVAKAYMALRNFTDFAKYNMMRSAWNETVNGNPAVMTMMF